MAHLEAGLLNSSALLLCSTSRAILACKPCAVIRRGSQGSSAELFKTAAKQNCTKLWRKITTTNVLFAIH